MAWIMGSSRSGSTWLVRMLADLEGVLTIDDPHLGHHLGVWRPVPLAWATSEGSAPELTTLSEVKRHKPSYFFSDRYREVWQPALKQMVLSRFQAQAADGPVAGKGPGSPRVIVKEPGSHVADEIMGMFPRSGLIFLLRDGRDVVDSWLAAYRPGSWAQSEGAYPLSSEGRIAMIRWQAAVWVFRTGVVFRTYEGHKGPKVMVRYEQLIADPLAELERINDALGLGADSERLQVIADRHSIEAVSDADKGPLREVRSGRSGGWRANRDEPERRAMIEALGPSLRAAGYECEAVADSGAPAPGAIAR